MAARTAKTSIERLQAALGSFKTRIVDGELFVRVSPSAELRVARYDEMAGAPYYVGTEVRTDPTRGPRNRRIGAFDSPTDVISLAHAMRSGAFPIGT